jgi:mono/diheme cytochrome c family protein
MIAALTGLLTIAAIGAAAAPAAQDFGDVARGREVARSVCAECHAVEKGQAQSPNLEAPPFEAIANVAGMTAIALSAALHTSHRTMPNIVLPEDDARDLIAYILSLRSGG